MSFVDFMNTAKELQLTNEEKLSMIISNPAACMTEEELTMATCYTAMLAELRDMGYDFVDLLDRGALA